MFDWYYFGSIMFGILSLVAGVILMVLLALVMELRTQRRCNRDTVDIIRSGLEWQIRLLNSSCEKHEDQINGLLYSGRAKKGQSDVVV